ncbi:hypothetical protein [Treponema endosymbiont of Eucomonympha sp.]|uniref:hypothetical protein n=1 Tax=Treponema endosymbiont of Eucomonympha sp. TaxID=1580831 RepID=UPI000782D1CE|nr:hypothetical protein [Treponema endosymbiont of Eucomonympha sp.]
MIKLEEGTSTKRVDNRGNYDVPYYRVFLTNAQAETKEVLFYYRDAEGRAGAARRLYAYKEFFALEMYAHMLVTLYKLPDGMSVSQFYSAQTHGNCFAGSVVMRERIPYEEIAAYMQKYCDEFIANLSKLEASYDKIENRKGLIGFLTVCKLDDIPYALSLAL